jgi:NAD+ synthase
MFDAKKVKNDVVAWIRDYFDENGKGCRAVAGISGGKDSSVVAALCAEALGADRVYGVLMPCGEQYDIGMSYELVALLGINHCVINIENSVSALLASVRNAGLTPNEQAEVNAPARVRMATLYAVSAIVTGRVANTCNLSEDYVGYSTKFGDSAGDFSPLAKLTASEVIAVGRSLGLPPQIVDKIPEDGLSGLTDEEKLGFTYAALDEYIRDGVCGDRAIKEKIDGLQRQNRHKLAPMPCFEYKA